MLENAQTFRGDPQKVAVMGESAGGNLAIGVSMMARDAGLPAPKHQVLVYPVAGMDMDNESYVENADAKPLNKPMMKWFVKHIFANEADAQDPRIDIVEKANLSGLPSTTVICAGGGGGAGGCVWANAGVAARPNRRGRAKRSIEWPLVARN